MAPLKNILFVTADLKERQKKWEEAKAGWQLYNEWVFAQSDGGTFPLSAGGWSNGRGGRWTLAIKGELPGVGSSQHLAIHF